MARDERGVHPHPASLAAPSGELGGAVTPAGDKG
jgi:hypothetical protein